MPNARKPHSDFAGYVAELRNKLSGGHNVICDCKRAEFEGNPWVADYKMEGGRYRVLCDTHSTLVYCTNLPAARSCMKDATEFCDLCRVIAGQISIDNAGLTVEDKAKVLDRIAQRDGLTFGNLTAETAERIGFDAAPPSLADDVQAIRALLVDAPPETPDTTPEALRYGADSTEAAELAYALSRVLALLKEVSLNSAEVQTAISIASNALGITGHPPIHTRDSDCTIDPQTGCCTVCGVEHREPCPDCGHTAFHSAGCWLTRDIPSAALPSETTEDK